MSIDWSTTDGCPMCTDADRDLHTAWRGFSAAMLTSLRVPDLVRWLAVRLDR